MRINNLNLVSYGKFKDKKIEFNNGLTVIYGENESGKSTIATALKTFLYNQYPRGNPYKRNMIPLGEKIASYTAEFTLDDATPFKTYISLGETNSKTVFRTLNLNTGQELGLGGTSIGEGFLEITEDFFDSVCYIKDIGEISEISSNEHTIHESLIKRPAKDAADANISKALDNLKEDINKYERKSMTGIIYPIEKRLNEIEEELEILNQKREQELSILLEIEQLERQLSQLEKQRREREKQEAHTASERQREQKQKIAELTAQMENIPEEAHNIDEELLNSIIKREKQAETVKDELFKMINPVGADKKLKMSRTLFIIFSIGAILSAVPCFYNPFLTPIPIVLAGISLIALCKIKGAVALVNAKRLYENKESELNAIKSGLEADYKRADIINVNDYLQKRSVYIENQANKRNLKKEIDFLKDALVNTSYSLSGSSKEALTEEITDKSILLAQLKERLNSGFQNLPDLDTLLYEKQENLKKINEKKERLHILKTTYDILTRAKESVKSDYIPRLNKEMAEIAACFSDYEPIVNEHIHIKLRHKESALLLEKDRFSQGTGDLMYFALRMAVHRIAFAGKESAPLILDDSFIELDDNRHRKIMDFLLRQTGVQIIYFTAHGRIFNLPLEKDSIITL